MNYINVTSSPFILSNNSFNTLFLYTGANIIKLPIIYLQREYVNIVNTTSGNITITDSDGNTVSVISANGFQTLFPNSVLDKWVIMYSGLDNSLSANYFVNGGNAFSGGAILGTTVPSDLYFINNSNVIAELTPNSLSMLSKQINFLADPTSIQDAATKGYVDNAALLVNGSNSMINNLNMGTYQINNLANPSLNQDAASKFYVDNAIITDGALLVNGTNSIEAVAVGRHVAAVADVVVMDAIDGVARNQFLDQRQQPLVGVPGPLHQAHPDVAVRAGGELVAIEQRFAVGGLAFGVELRPFGVLAEGGAVLPLKKSISQICTSMPWRGLRAQVLDQVEIADIAEK